MARLPGPQDMGGVRISESGRPIASYDSQQVGNAMSSFGGSLARAGERGMDIAEKWKKDAGETEDLKATSDWLSRKVKLDEERDNITDPGELEKHKPNYQTGLNESAALISDPKRRENFILKHGPTVTTADVASNTRKFDLEKDADNAVDIEELGKLEQAALKSKDPRDRDMAVEAAKRRIQLRLDKGYISETEAVIERKRWITGFAAKSFGMMPPQERLRALGEGVDPAEMAKKYAGIGESNQPEVLTEFFKKTGGKAIDPRETPWCAAFVDAVLGASGKQQAGTLRAADFLKYGTPTTAPTKGDIVVFEPQARGASGHVGFVVGIEGDRIRYIAGNDGNQVRENTLPLSSVVGFRVPPPANTPIEGLKLDDPRAKQIAEDANKTVKPSPLLDFIPVENRQPMADQARGEIDALRRKEQIALRDERANIAQRMTDDLKSIERTGQGMDASTLPRERIVATHGEEATRTWEAERTRAHRVFTATDGIEKMTEADVEARVKMLEPKPGTPGYAEDTAAYDQARKKAAAIIQARNSDPALAVDVFESVRAARQAQKYTDVNGVKVITPESAQATVAARLAAQDALGIDNPMPITKSESRPIARQLRSIGTDNPDLLNTFMAKMKATYGDYAGQVLAATIQHEGVNRDLANEASRLLDTISMGNRPTEGDKQKIETLAEADKIEGALNGKPPSQRRPNPMGRVYQQGILDNERAGGEQRALRELSGNNPAADAAVKPEELRALLKGQMPPQEYDARYGPGAAEKAVKEAKRRGVTVTPFTAPAAPAPKTEAPAADKTSAAPSENSNVLSMLFQQIVGGLSEDNRTKIIGDLANQQAAARKKPDSFKIVRGADGRATEYIPVYNQ